MILGIGVDIVTINRLSEDKSERFMERTFAPSEQRYIKGRSTATMAGLFAAKEAIAKALGTGFKGFWPAEIEIEHDDNGAPKVVLHGKAEETAKGLGANSYRIHLNISHSETSALAFAIIEGASYSKEKNDNISQSQEEDDDSSSHSEEEKKSKDWNWYE